MISYPKINITEYKRIDSLHVRLYIFEKHVDALIKRPIYYPNFIPRFFTRLKIKNENIYLQNEQYIAIHLKNFIRYLMYIDSYLTTVTNCNFYRSFETADHCTVGNSFSQLRVY